MQVQVQVQVQEPVKISGSKRDFMNERANASASVKGSFVLQAGEVAGEVYGTQREGVQVSQRSR